MREREGGGREGEGGERERDMAPLEYWSDNYTCTCCSA